MLSAILEITVMLLVAFGLGALFLHFRWKSKYQQLLHEFNAMQQVHEGLKKDHSHVVAAFEKSKMENAAAIEDLKKKWTLEKSKREKIEKDWDKDLKKHEEERAEMIQAMENMSDNVQKAEMGRVREREIKEVETKRLNEEIDSLQAEIEKLKNAPQKKRAARYYRTIGDKKYDDHALKVAEKAVSGKGDGRISKGDVEELFAAIADGNQYTDIEKATIKYIREHFTWTPEADELFRQKVRDWARERSHTPEG